MNFWRKAPLDEIKPLRYNTVSGQDTLPARFLSEMAFRRSVG